MAYTLMEWLHKRGIRVVVISATGHTPVPGESHRHIAQAIHCDCVAGNVATCDERIRLADNGLDRRLRERTIFGRQPDAAAHPSTL